MRRGTVKWIYGIKGFGFISCDDNDARVFVNLSGRAYNRYISLEDGAHVTFDLKEGNQGIEAVNINLS